MPVYDWANCGCVNFFLCMVSMILFLWGVDAVLWNDYGIQQQNYLVLLQGSEMTAGFCYRKLILGI